MSKRLTRVLLMLLVFAMCITMIAPVTASAAQMRTANLKDILNNTTLYPQRTGYAELDHAIAAVLKPYESSDTYTKIVALYDWTAQQVKYSWEYYSKTTAPAYDCFTKTYNLTYDEGLEESIPKDMVYRSYHSITAKRGVCYDYAILFAVMARYVGLEAYVHTGYYIFESWSGISGSGHHGWAEIVIDGQTYVFDPQRDNRYTSKCGYQTRAFFGIAWADAWRYNHEYQDFAANKARDESMLPVSAARNHTYNVKAICSPSGSGISGIGTYNTNDEVILQSSSDTPVRAWYDLDGKLLCTGSVYKFNATDHVSVIALFDNDYFLDVPAHSWYTDDVNEAAERQLVNGTAPLTFDANTVVTRAMVVQFLARVDNADTSIASTAPFTDVSQSSWYADAVNWAYENKIINGISDTKFAPNSPVSRQDFITMIMRYVNGEGIYADGTALTFTDSSQISQYAADAVAEALTIKLIEGYSDNTVRPKAEITRAEAVTILMRTVRYIEEGYKDADEPADIAA